MQDIVAGIVVTAPGLEDPEFGPLVDKYLAGRRGVGGRERWKLAELLRDLTASEFGGYSYLVTLHGEGSMQAQLLQTVRDDPLTDSIATVRSILDSRAAVDPPDALPAALWAGLSGRISGAT